MRNTGKVKWFNDTKGFGFITDDEGDDVFVHHASIIAHGFQTLRSGDRVVFEISNLRGRQAVNVRAVAREV